MIYSWKYDKKYDFVSAEKRFIKKEKLIFVCFNEK